MVQPFNRFRCYTKGWRLAKHNIARGFVQRFGNIRPLLQPSKTCNPKKYGGRKRWTIEKTIKLKDMKTIVTLLSKSAAIISVLLLISNGLANAQASYAGGVGGGYSSTAIIQGTLSSSADSIIKKNFDATIFPNPLKNNDVLKAKFSGINNGGKVTIIISDMIGTRLYAEEVDILSELTINVPFDKLTKGVYLITFQYNSNRITRRFNFSG